VPVVSIDGRIVSPEQATVSVFDRGFLYGDGLFETFRTWDGAAVDAAEHLARLRHSAQALQLKVGAIEIDAAIAAAGQGDHRVRVIVTRGEGALGARLGALGPGRTIVIVEPLGALPGELAAVVVDLPLARRREGHKTLAYLDSLIARELAAAAGADEALRCDAEGYVAEGSTSNVFVVEGERVVTPSVDGGALAGVTRGQVIAWWPGVSERRLTVDELRAADEIFVTSAVRGVVAVTQLDGVARPAGPVTARIADAHARKLRERAKQFAAQRHGRG